LREVRPNLVYAIVLVSAIAVGIGLRAETLEAGFSSDDYMEYVMIKGVYPVPRSPLDLFNFSDGSAAEVKALRDYGTIPWWSHPSFRLAMMRPLSSALIVLDHRLFGSDWFAFHLHSLIWWVILLIAAALLLRDLFPLPVAATALLLFTVDESHTLPVAWLANRGALVSLGLGFLGLWAHLRWRSGKGVGWMLFGTCALALAFLAGEWTTPVLAYLFAFEVWGARDAWGKRFVSLLPAAALTLGFLGLQRVFSYSSANSNVYINPFAEPWLFFFEALRRVPVYLADLILGIPTHWAYTGSPLRRLVLAQSIFTPQTWKLIPDWQYWHVLIGIAAGIIAVVTVRWAMRDRPEPERHALRWLIWGALLSLLPMVSSFTSSRSCLPALLGFSAACALVFVHAFERVRAAFGQRPVAVVVKPVFALVCIGYLHIGNAAARSFNDIESRVSFHKSIENWIAAAPIDDRQIAHQDVYLINAIDHTTMFFGPFVRYFRGHPMPRGWRILNGSPRAQDVFRPSAHTLEISPLGGTLMKGSLEVFYRASRFPLKLGETVSLRGLKAEVILVRKGYPARVRFTFDKPLEDPSYLFLRFTSEGLVKFQPPLIGKQIRLARPSFPRNKESDPSK
jgi:hypothetical protein